MGVGGRGELRAKTHPRPGHPPPAGPAVDRRSRGGPRGRAGGSLVPGDQLRPMGAAGGPLPRGSAAAGLRAAPGPASLPAAAWLLGAAPETMEAGSTHAPAPGPPPARRP